MRSSCYIFPYLRKLVAVSLILTSSLCNVSFCCTRGATATYLFASAIDMEEECTVTEDGEIVCTAAEASTSTSAHDPKCGDDHENCSFWAERGECTANPGYMLKSCRRSCKVCGVPVSEKVLQEKEKLRRLVAEYGEPQEVTGDTSLTTLAVIKRTVSYMKNFVFSDKPTHSMSEDVKKSCKNRNELCSFWAAIGECEANPAFMATSCAPSCRSCHMIDFETRCPPRSNDAVPGLRPGDLNEMFERIVRAAPRTDGDGDKKDAGKSGTVAEDGSPLYRVSVLSRPAPVPESERSVSKVRDLEQPPWVITFDDFLTHEECDHMIQLGYKSGYKRSKDVGSKSFDGTHEGKESTGRTSENAWCSVKEGCRDDAIARRIHERLTNVTGIPAVNSEDLQLLKYEVGQFYNTHHDYIPHQRDRQCGPRILTFFLYLSDVEEGGGTNFPALNPPITVYPKKGRALLWPSVLDSDPLMKDGRTQHQALPVEKGTKFAANAWIHLYDYLTPQKLGCT